VVPILTASLNNQLRNTSLRSSNNQNIHLLFIHFGVMKLFRPSSESEPTRTLIFERDVMIILNYIFMEEPGKLSRYSDWLRAGQRRGRSSSPGRIKNFFFTLLRPALGSTQPLTQWVPGVKRTGREADHSPPASAEVKQMWMYTRTPPYAFMAQCLIS
jgi:hypothetical protein